jgi:hypothetical protein
MKRIQSLFSNVFLLVLLLALAVGLVFLLSNPSQNDGRTNQPSVQASDSNSPLPTPTSAIGKETRTPVDEKATSTPTATSPTATSDLPDDVLEPTWTPVIILPEGTSPPRPTPLPTPTATPPNPKESMIVALDAPVGDLVISPDGQMLAVSAKIESESKGIPVRQIWTIDLTSKQVQRLEAYGIDPLWSLDGQQILYRVRQGDQYEIKIVSKNGMDRNLSRLSRKDFLNYHWFGSEQIEIIGIDGVHRVDLNGRTIDWRELSVFRSIKDLHLKQVAQSPDGTIVIGKGSSLLIIQKNGGMVEIVDEAERWIDRFSLSRDGQWLAYVVNEGPNDEMWINDLNGSAPKMLYRIEMGHIRDVIWMPDSQTILFGWGETGTNVPTTLTWLDIRSGQFRPVGVHGVDQNIVVNQKGDKMYYGRTISDDAGSTYKTTLYQLEIEK